jgi:serine protease Do
MLAWPGFKKAEGPTTGVIVSSDGHIVTSAWTFEGKPTVITATVAGGRTYAARLLGIDRAAGLALIKIEAEGLPVPRFLKPDDVRIGAWAFAIGRAISRDQCEVKYGIVSARNRIEGNALQTDAATSPTNYGGPLIDVEGAVYGIIVPLGSRGQETNPNWYDSGIGFATPIPDPQRLIERLGKDGVELKPAMLGVNMDQDRTEPGALITDVAPDTGAANAGLRKGDIIRKIDGTVVENGFTLRFAIGRRRAGDSVKLVIERDGKELELTAVLGERAQRELPDERVPVPMPGPDRKRDRDKKRGDR